MKISKLTFIHFLVGSARLIMNSRCCQTQQPHGVEKSNKVNYTNRNSTGSTNSSQTSSGFESSKVGIFFGI